jgi:deazaflavin-dependent oxidoreductase (nitroreductase family)
MLGRMSPTKPKPAPFTPRQVAFGRVVIRAMSALNVWVYRLTGGRVGGKFIGGAPVCLLTHVGRKSGKRRIAPLLYLEDGERVVIVASQGGMPKHPVWYLNLKANPDCEVQIGSRTRKLRAREAGPAEKAGLWPKLVAMYPEYDDYQARTDRVIPVMILDPA